MEPMIRLGRGIRARRRGRSVRREEPTRRNDVAAHDPGPLTTPAVSRKGPRVWAKGGGMTSPLLSVRSMGGLTAMEAMYTNKRNSPS